MPPRFFLSPDDLNEYDAQVWESQQNQQLADQWAAQATATLAPPPPAPVPTIDDALSRLGTGFEQAQPAQPTEPAPAPMEPVGLPEPAASPVTQPLSPPDLSQPAPAVAGPSLRSTPPASARPAPTPTTAELSGAPRSTTGNLSGRAQAILSGAVDTAAWLGDQGQKALQAILVTEGGLNNARGDQGSSAGPLQFFGEEGGRAGQLNAYAAARGLSLDQARADIERDPIGAIQWAIGTPDRPGYLGSALARGLQQGLSGADLATFGQKVGQVSVSPERAGQNFLSLFGGGQPAISGSTATPGPGVDLGLSQFGDRTLSADEAAAACGPFAAMRLAATYGNSIPASVALQAAKQVGWTPGGGMAGVVSEKKLFDALGLPSELDTSGNWGRIVDAANQGKLVTISTPGHYFSASGARPRSDGQTELYVGQSGLDLKGGKAWMTPSEIESRMGALSGALFSDPGNAVQAGEWMQRAALDHGITPESPDQILQKLGQDYQKAGLRTPTGLEQITQPFGEAMQQIASVRGQLRPEVAGVQAEPGLFDQGGAVGQAFSGLGAGVSNALTSAGLAPTGQEGITQGPSGETPPDWGAAAESGREKLSQRGIDLTPQGLTPLSPDVTRLPGILRGPILTTDQELLDQARPDDLDAARQLLTVSGVANPTPAQLAEALRGQRIGQAYAGTHTGAGGVPEPLGPQPTVERPTGEAVTPEQLQSTIESLGQQWDDLGREITSLYDQAAAAFNPGLKQQLTNRAETLRKNQDDVMRTMEYIDTHGALPINVKPAEGLAETIPDPLPVSAPAEPTVPRAAQPSAPTGATTNAILSSPNYRRLQAMRGTPEQAAALRPAEEGFAGNINLEKAITPDDVKLALQRNMEQQNQFAGQRRGVITDAEAQQNAAAKALTMAPEDWIKTKPGRAFNQEEALALGNQLVRTGNEYSEMRATLAARELSGDATDLERAAVADKALELALLEGVRSGAASEAGRALRSFRQALDGALRSKDGDTSKAFRTALKAIGTDEDKYAAWVRAWDAVPEGNTVDRYKLLQALHQPSKMQKIVAFTTSSMLSGNKTLETNVLGGAIETVNRPLIELLGGRPVDAFTDVAAMGRAIGQAWGNAGTTLTTGVRPSRAAAALADPSKYEAVRPEAFEGMSGLAWTPALRISAASDEFIRTLNAAGGLAVGARREAKATGKTVQDVLSEAPDHVLKYAQDVADRSVLEGTGSPVARKINSMRRLIESSDPAERATGVIANVLFPFVNIPEQILIGGARMLPGVNEASTIMQIRKGLQSGDTQTVRDAAARYVLTDAILVATYGQVAAGNVTGMGPKDPQKRAALEAARDADGNKVWQAHSIKVGDRWFDYTNLGRVAIPLAAVSNAVEAYNESGRKPGANEVADVFNRVGETMLDATYIRSFGDVMKSIGEGNLVKAGGSLIGNTAARFVPLGGLAAQLERTTDQERKNPRNLPEYIASRIPGLSELVPDKPSPFGGSIQEPQDIGAVLSPVRTSAPGFPDQVANAFVEAGMGAPRTPDTVSIPSQMSDSRSPPIKLTDDEKMRYTQIMGDRLKTLIGDRANNPRWQQTPIADRKTALEHATQAARDYAALQIYRQMEPADRQQRMDEGRKAKEPVPLLPR